MNRKTEPRISVEVTGEMPVRGTMHGLLRAFRATVTVDRGPPSGLFHYGPFTLAEARAEQDRAAETLSDCVTLGERAERDAAVLRYRIASAAVDALVGLDRTEGGEA